jgi:hypothetical protein
MVWHRGMPMSILVLVVQCRQLFYDNVIARFLFNFANGSDARGVTDICPTTGYSPKAVLSLSHEQYPSSSVLDQKPPRVHRVSESHIPLQS